MTRTADPLFRDGLFRRQAKKGAFRIVEAPALGAPIADSHAHVHLLPDPALALARCAVNGVGFVCCVTDVVEDDDTLFSQMDEWLRIAQEGDPFTPREGDGANGARGDDLGRASEEAVDETEGAEAAFPREAGVADGLDLGAMARAHDALASGEVRVPDVRFAVGCHPHAARLFDAAAEVRLRDRLRYARVSAIGEIGLDYYYDFSPREAQIDAFRRQIRLAHEVGLPIVLHIRDAHDDALAVLRDEGFPAAGTLLHCCSVGPRELEPWLDAGCYVAFGGAVTFGRSDDLRASARIVPADRILVETDAPYMTPAPMRGMTCWPDHSVFAAARLADERGCDSAEARAAFARQLMDNARRLLDRAPLDWQEAR